MDLQVLDNPELTTELNKIFSGWQLSWAPGSQSWEMSNTRYPDIEAEVTGWDYPLGSRAWRVRGDGCSAQTREVELSLSSCLETEYSCDDGQCVGMAARCDQHHHCTDGSDEKNCRVVQVDREKYLKDKQPPTGGGEEKVRVEVDLHITKILKIDEVIREKVHPTLNNINNMKG